jgi:hypothetical protein
MAISRAQTAKQVTKAPGSKKVAKKADDECVRKVKARYKVWPSAYASGAVAKCRKVGAKNWGNSTKSSKKSGSKKAKSY